jgi:hypothetical protein
MRSLSTVFCQKLVSRTWGTGGAILWQPHCGYTHQLGTYYFILASFWIYASAVRMYPGHKKAGRSGIPVQWFKILIRTLKIFPFPCCKIKLFEIHCIPYVQWFWRNLSLKMFNHTWISPREKFTGYMNVHRLCKNTFSIHIFTFYRKILNVLSELI